MSNVLVTSLATIKLKIMCYLLYSNGLSSQPIWLDDVQCTSSVTSCLGYCESCPSYEYHNCVHSEDVSLECGL